MCYEKEAGFGGRRPDAGLERRVARLEDEMQAVRKDMSEIKISLARVEGKIDGFFSRVPSTQQLWAMTIGSWIAGAGIVLVAMRMLAS